MLSWILLFSLLTIHTDNYSPSQTRNMKWIQTKQHIVSKKIRTVELQNETPLQSSSKGHTKAGSSRNNPVLISMMPLTTVC